MANEPVAWHYPDGKPDQCTTDKAYAEKEPAWTPMYYKHEWVGLTDEELDALYRAVKVRLMGTYDTKDIYRAVEAKLKEKNNG
jgi:superfamily I DNA and RNA helicase